MSSYRFLAVINVMTIFSIDTVNMHFGAGQPILDLLVSNQTIYVVYNKTARSNLD